MAHNFLEPVDDHFNFSTPDGNLEDDVDDDLFLSNSRRPAGHNIGRSTNPFENDAQSQTFAQKRRDIEQRSLESTQKSLGLLYETEEVGKATAYELAKQREQLEKTSRHLDEINSSLRFSQRHLNGLKSVFGGLKNYLSGNKGSGEPSNVTSPTCSRGDSQVFQPEPSILTSTTEFAAPTSSNGLFMDSRERYDDHPISRLRNSTLDERYQTQQMRSSNPFQAQLDANLEEMCGNLSRLKCLATDLGGEIESQNELLDNMNYKIEDVDIKIGKQNKDIGKMLGKK